MSALPANAASWLATTLADNDVLVSRTRLRLAFTQLPRKLGPVADSQAAGEPAPCTVLDLARLALVLAAFERTPPSEHAATLDELYRTGEQREQQSILRTLIRYPEPARFTTLAVEACRTNSVLVFSAIANDNPFPAHHFPELSFNQLVLKAIFLGVPVARIQGLASRVNSELRRMLQDYASERRAAGRVLPEDVSAVLALRF
ncbi:MAG: hypothetical protein RLZZ450_6989 [Pseudomonadota bacterium]